MYNFTNPQNRLALVIADAIQRSSCNVGECIQVLTTHLAGLIGRHAPNDLEIERFGAVIGEDIIRQAHAFNKTSDILPKE